MDEQFVHEDQMRNARTQGVGSMVSEQNRQNALELMQKMHKIDTQNLYIRKSSTPSRMIRCSVHGTTIQQLASAIIMGSIILEIPLRM